MGERAGAHPEKSFVNRRREGPARVRLHVGEPVRLSPAVAAKEKELEDKVVATKTVEGNTNNLAAVDLSGLDEGKGAYSRGPGQEKGEKTAHGAWEAEPTPTCCRRTRSRST